MTRQIYAIRALIQPGNSGGPLIDPQSGKVFGVVFAAAVGVKDVGYALTAAEVAGDVARGRAGHRTPPVLDPGCASLTRAERDPGYAWPQAALDPGRADWGGA